MANPEDATRQLAVDIIYGLLLERGGWPTFAVVDRRLDQAGHDAEETLGSLPAGWLRGDPRSHRWSQPDMEVVLSLTGVAQAAEAGDDVTQLAALIRWAVDQERAHDPGATGGALVITGDDAALALGLEPGVPATSAVIRRLGILIDLIPGLWGGRSTLPGPPWWSITVARGIRRFRGLNGPEDLVRWTEAAWSPPARPAVAAPPAVRALESPVEATDEYDVALSFAGEEREYVEQVATKLRGAGITVFYDAFEEVALWGQNLRDRFADVYGRQARYVVMFVSASYAAKAWTNVERAEAQARALETQRDLVLPVRFDDTPLLGLPGTVAYLRAADYTPEALAEVIVTKLQADSSPADARSNVGPEIAGPTVAIAASPNAAKAGTAPAGALGFDAWLARHREAAAAGLAGMGKSDHYEVVARVAPPIPMPSQLRLSEAVRDANIETFGWPIGVYLPTQPPRPTTDGVIAEVAWAERESYDYWSLSRDGRFYLLKTLSEDALLAPDRLYANTRIVRVAETVMFLTATYRALGAADDAKVSLEILHAGLRHRTLAAVGRRAFSFRERSTIEDHVVCRAEFRLGDGVDRLAEIVKDLVAPLFMVYEYFEIADPVVSDIVQQFKAGKVT